MQHVEEVGVDLRPPAEGGVLGALRGVARVLLRTPRRWAWIPPVAWMGLIWYLSSRPVGRAFSPSAWHSFVWNLAHGPEFGTLALLWLPALPRAGRWVRLGTVQAATVVALGGLYAIVDEVHQAGIPNRASSVGDALTDLVAISSVLVVARYVISPGATERGLLLRLLGGALAVVLGALLATFEHLLTFWT